MFSLLKVIKCDGLKKVFSVSVIEYFLHLEELYLANCLIMKEVIADVEGKEYGEDVVFPQLHSIGLVNLPNLTSFCAGLFKFEFPSLEYLNLEVCPGMFTFSLGPLVTPKLNAIVLENGEQLWKGDLNGTIKHLSMAKVTLQIALPGFGLNLEFLWSGPFRTWQNRLLGLGGMPD
ncbi:uncharacterized protein LOC143558612 [Bidens hawaiensis]|uniref:uncharacterized protein LOC143558612 n=1 Tax=Bidens hawaiensis TaxID=980011 RepID=UPI00404A2E6B